MRAVQLLRRMMAYDGWANEETLESLRSATSTPRAVHLLAHIVGAEWLWLHRLNSGGRVSPVWPDLDLAACEAQLPELRRAWEVYLGGLDEARLAARITYTNSKGEAWTSTVQDVSTHVVTHSAYHRGQIAAELRAAQHTPASTDFIHCTRQGFID